MGSLARHPYWQRTDNTLPPLAHASVHMFSAHNTNADATMGPRALAAEIEARPITNKGLPDTNITVHHFFWTERRGNDPLP